MYIYRIINNINGKSYIGSTKDTKERFKQHIKSSKYSSSQSYNYPLQRAFRKYGIENFSFTIIEECELDIVAEREKYYIVKYNTLTNKGYGYNQTLETECALRDPLFKQQQIEKYGKKCVLVDKNNNILQFFSSYHEAARIILGINEASCVREVCTGERSSYNGYIFRQLDKNGEIILPQKQPRPLKTKICGIYVFDNSKKIYYDSISEAADKEKIERRSIHRCIAGEKRFSQVNFYIWRKIDENGNIIDNNISINSIIEEYNRRYIFYNNEWTLVSKVAEQKGLKPATVMARIRRGWTKERALEL